MSSPAREAAGNVRPAVGSATDLMEGWDAPVQTLRVLSRHFTELHVCARPSNLAAPFEAQAASMYSNLLAELSARGAAQRDMPRHGAPRRNTCGAARLNMGWCRGAKCCGGGRAGRIENAPIWGYN